MFHPRQAQINGEEDVCTFAKETATSSCKKPQSWSVPAAWNATRRHTSSSRRHDVQQRYFLRAVPQRLMAVLDCSLIIVRVVHLGLPAHPRQILVPVLGGAFDNAERAYLVSQLAVHVHANLIVFHTLECTPRRGQAVPHETGARQVRTFVDRLREAGCEPQVRIVRGPRVGEAIMQEAARHRHDLIIMRASQRSLFSIWRRGNPVEDVMRRTPCDLFVCRTRRRM